MSDGARQDTAIEQDALIGEAEQTVSTLRGEADELEQRQKRNNDPVVQDVIEQMRHRADRIEEVLGYDV